MGILETRYRPSFLRATLLFDRRKISCIAVHYFDLRLLLGATRASSIRIEMPAEQGCADLTFTQLKAGNHMNGQRVQEF